MKPLSIAVLVMGAVIVTAAAAFFITKLIIGKKRKCTYKSHIDETDPLHPMYEYSTAAKEDVCECEEDEGCCCCEESLENEVE